MFSKRKERRLKLLKSEMKVEILLKALDTREYLLRYYNTGKVL